MSNVVKQTVELEVENGKKPPIVFDIWTDAGDMLEAAVINWVARRKPHQLTADNLCEYIRSKGLHRAFSKQP